jgi:hypothetical protein
MKQKPEIVPIGIGDIWERQLLLSSIPLKCLSQEKQVLGNGSACVIEYHDHRLILSVSHVTLRAGMWAMEINYVSELGMQLLPLPQMNFLGRVPIDDLLRSLREGTLQDMTKDMVDFSYGILPNNFESFHEQYGEDFQLHWRAPRTVFKTTLEEDPKDGVKYGFSGHTQLERLPHPRKPNLTVLCANHTIHGDLLYSHTDNDLHFFKLPGKHPGHEYFRGCSGAPILDGAGKVVALVAGGDTEKDLIFGVSLKTYKSAIDIEVGKFAN